MVLKTNQLSGNSDRGALSALALQIPSITALTLKPEVQEHLETILQERANI